MPYPKKNIRFTTVKPTAKPTVRKYRSVKQQWADAKTKKNSFVAAKKPSQDTVSLYKKRTEKKKHMKKRDHHTFSSKKDKDHVTVGFSNSYRLFPDKFMCKTLVDTGYLTLTTNASTSPNWGTIKTNSWFDPLGSFAATKPIGYNELITFYSEYTVYCCELTIEYYVVSAATEEISLCCGFNSAGTAPPTTVSLCKSLPNYKVIPMYKGSGLVCTHKEFLYCNKILDLSREDYNSFAIGAVGADPGIVATYDIGFSSFNNTAVAVQYMITMKQYIELSSPYDLAGSGAFKEPEFRLYKGLVLPPALPREIVNKNKQLCFINSDEESSVDIEDLTKGLTESDIKVLNTHLKHKIQKK